MARREIWGACLILVGLACLAVVPVFKVLEISDPGAGTVVLRAEMEDGEEFAICFLHSVNRRPVCDTLRVERDHLVIARSRFDSFGAGMPDGSTNEGVLRRLPDGWLEWKVEKPVPELTLRVGRVAEHRLLIKGQEVFLAQLAAPGQALTFRPGRSSIWDRLTGRWIR